jgi:hypothetical protein
MTDLVEIIADLRLVLHWESKRMGAVSAGLLKSTIDNYLDNHAPL